MSDVVYDRNETYRNASVRIVSARFVLLGGSNDASAMLYAPLSGVFNLRMQFGIVHAINIVKVT